MTAPIHSRGTLGWLGAVLAGGMSAAFFGVAVSYHQSLLTFLAYLAAIPLFVAGLGAGFLSGIVAALIGLATLYFKVSPEAAFSYFVLYGLPVSFLTALALRAKKGENGKIYWYPEGYLLTGAILYPCLLFVIAVVLSSGQEGGLLGITTQAMQAASENITSEMDPAMAEQIKAAINRTPFVMPSLLGGSWLFLIVVSVFAAQSTLKQQDWNLRPAFAWQTMQMPNWLLPGAALAALTGFLAPAPYDYIGMNFALLFCAPFCFLGVALLHVFAARQPKGRWILVSFYVVLAIVPWLLILVTLAGAIEQVFRFRQRLAALPLQSGK